MKKDYRIDLPNYFEWQSIIDYLSRESNEIMYQITSKNEIRRAFNYSGNKYLIEIIYKNKYLQVKVLVGKVEAPDIEEKIIPFIREWFDIDTNLEQFYTIARNDDILSSLVKKFTGLRLIGMPDFYEAITWGILGQQINLAYTYTLKKRFTEKFGEKINYHQQDYWIYPDPIVVAQASQKELLSLRLTQRKAEYLSDITKKIVANEISKDLYASYDTAVSAEREMTKLRGIGAWTANYVLMRCIRMGDAFPMADIGLLNGVKIIKNLEEKPNKEYILQLKYRWKIWSSYATFYIWRLLY